MQKKLICFIITHCDERILLSILMSLYQNLYRFYYAHRDYSSTPNGALEERQKKEQTMHIEFLNYSNALIKSKKRSQECLQEFKNNYLALIKTDIEAYLDEPIYAYKDNKSILLSDRIDFAFALHRDESLNAAIYDKTLSFLGYALDIHPELLQKNNINEFLLQLMHDRNQHKESNPTYIPGRTPITNNMLCMQGAYIERDKRESIHYLELYKKQKYQVLITRGTFKQNNIIFDTTKYTAHGKPGWAACVIDPNGDFFVFNHTFGEGLNPLKHSSFTQGGPVFFAGELIITRGVLKAIAPMSGHYQPNLFQIYVLLEYLSEHSIDISKANVITQNNPSEYLADVHSTLIKKQYPPVFHLGHNKKEYYTPAHQLYQSIHSKLVPILHQTRQEIKDFWHTECWGITGVYSFLQKRITGESTPRPSCIKLAKKLDPQLKILLKEASLYPHKKQMALHKVAQLEHLIKEFEQALSVEPISPQLNKLNNIVARAKQSLITLESNETDELKRINSIQRCS